MNACKRTSEFLSNISLAIAGTALAAMMLLACANMVSRAVWLPVKGTYELMGFGGALVAAFGLAPTQIRRGHIALTVLERVFPRRVERAIDAVSYLACCALFALAAWRATVWGWTLVDTGELSETLRFAYHPFVFAVALSLGLMALALFCDALENCRAMFRPAKPSREGRALTSPAASTKQAAASRRSTTPPPDSGDSGGEA